MDHGVATISRAFSTRTAAVARPNTRAFWVVGATLFVAIMANNLPSPLYSVYRSEWHFSALTLTGVSAVAAAAVLPTLIAFGSVSNRAGRRPVLLLAILFIAASDLVFLGAASVSWLYAGRILAGVGIGLAAGTAVAAMADFDVDHDHAARTGALATVSGQAVAPLAAGLLAQYAPMPTKLVFVLDLVVLMIIFGCLLRIPETVPGARWSDWRPKVVLGLPRPSRPAFALASLAAFGAFAVMGSSPRSVPRSVASLAIVVIVMALVTAAVSLGCKILDVPVAATEAA
jgi:MFS family permease